MTDPITILTDRIDERLQATGLSDRKASLNAIGKPDLIRDIKRGRMPSSSRLAALAEALGATSDYLLGKSDIIAQPVAPADEDEPKRVVPHLLQMEKDLPVYGTAIGAPAEFTTEYDGKIAVEQTDLHMSDVVDHLRRPPGLIDRRDIFALWVSGTSMEPAFESGRAILIDPKRPPSIRDYVVVYLRPRQGDDGESANCVLIKRLVRRSGSYVELEQFGPAGVFKIAANDVLKMYRVMPWDEAFGI
ncbi:S24 family peptidase [Sphingomonas sp.]|uniref:S24 family peptidase n=1 Tax=Sphingomonas sp. TaxID=28214 RepID=UPI0025EAD4C9|nr:S24 family peptidase [Sphingomonas sp.]